MTQAEITRLKQYCIGAGAEDSLRLLQYCNEVDPYIADDLYFYLRFECSYDKLETMRYIPASRSSFYERSIKVLSKFKEHLIDIKAWEK